LSDHKHRRLAFARLLSSAVVSQALLSAASFAIGLILIRSTTDHQYGYFVLASNAVLLLVSLQNAFCTPSLATRLGRLDRVQRGELVGGLYREQRRILPAAGAIVMLAALGLGFLQVLDFETAALVLATVAAALAILHREYFRIVLLALRRPHDVLRTDVSYVVLMVAGAVVATLTPAPAVTAILALGAAAVASGTLLARTLRRDEPWNTRPARGVLREIAPLAAWTTAGAAIHWSFSQGYVYLVAGTLDVAAVAALAATRLLLMPVNLLSTGIGSLMLPLASGWLHRYGPALLWRRLCVLAATVAATTLGYFALLWLARDWIFAVVFRKQFAQRDELLLLWGAVVLVMVLRIQLGYLLAAQGRFRALTLLTLVSAVTALAAGYVAMLQFGVAGALFGMLAGELINAVGIVGLSLRKVQQPLAAPV
jgi:O-antigen/teichoic acid export membrane protein